jgi:hypothetical protein
MRWSGMCGNKTFPHRLISFVRSVNSLKIVPVKLLNDKSLYEQRKSEREIARQMSAHSPSNATNCPNSEGIVELS